MRALALILARGGSKRVPGKNIADLGGKPLIAYTIECAKASKHIDRIIVSTDDEGIAQVAKGYGAEVPFMRPPEISGPDSKEIDAFKHALGWLKDNEGYEPDLIVKLFPTSPFRKSQSVDRAIELMIEHPEADSVRSVTLCSEHPYKMWRIEKGHLKPFIDWKERPPESHTFSYHLLPKVYIQNASIDVVKTSTIWKLGSITGQTIIPLEMEEKESIDINTELDLKLARSIIAGIQQNNQP